MLEATPLISPKPVTRSRDATRLRGEVVYMYAFDIAYDMQRKQLGELLGQPVGTFSVDSTKRAPRQLFFYRPQMIRLPPAEKFGPHGIVRMERVVKIMPVGAISITVKVPFEVDQLSDLVDFHELRFRDGSTVSDDAKLLGEQIRRELLPHLISPVQAISDVEAYTVFCIEGPLRKIYAGEEVDVSAEHWLQTHRRDVSALLTQEPDADLLSAQEAEESSSKYFSYYQDDICVIDWDAALIVDDPREFDEALYIMELANLQLAELEAYDRLLDESLERTYRDLGSQGLGRRRLGAVQKELRELRVDSARINDELSNITKFFGDWHLARLYQGLAARFHLDDWNKSVRNKLQALDEIYQLIHADSTNRIMIFLEVLIVLLFIFEVAKSFFDK
ncbi:MAG: hypothetical protein H7144_04670 [Burkholderiales bacterium]|nr:hypothetical protein [Phycisphaerae bacterium]